LSLVLCGTAEAAGDEVKRPVSYCDAIAARLPVGSEAAFIISYEPSEEGVALDPSLQNAAFVYDNALALIALLACEQESEARRVADALVFAVENDRFYKDGRVRNAYRAGAITESPVLLPGWWSYQENKWLEEPSQVGSSTGNVAWAALALLNAYEVTGELSYVDTAIKIMTWVAALPGRNERALAGFPGGFFGHEPEPTALTWKSTEHNIDTYAVFDWLDRIDASDDGKSDTWNREAKFSRAFVESMFDEKDGRFFIGTDLDGTTVVKTRTGLDAQFWPILAFQGFPAPWKRSVAWAETNHGVGGGFDFNDDRDGIWLEGTAQAALVYKVLGNQEKAEALLHLLGEQRSPGGFVFATSRDPLTTGLAVSPQSTDADFVYHRWPHLGATAWAALAERGWNPFTGRSL
jgi:hypothetical protein